MEMCEKLRKNHRRLKDTIRTHHITHITDCLKEKGVLKEDDFAKINRVVRKERRTEQLLYMLAKKTPYAVEAFIQSLKEVQEHGACPYEDIVQLLEQGTESDEDFKWTPVREIKEYIARHLDTKKACDDLVKLHILTEKQSDSIQKEEDPFERAQSLLCVLPTIEGKGAFPALCKVLHDQGLEDIVSFLNRASASDTLKPVTNVPEPVEHFLETNDVTKVEQALKNNPSPTIVSGIPKSGKTQITRRLARQFLEHHRTAVVWVLDGQNRQTLLASKRELLEALNAEVPDEEDVSRIDERLDQALQNRGTPVLLIVDDLEDGTLLTPTLLRERIQSRVMILTRQENLQLPAKPEVPHISVNGFSTEEAQNFISMFFKENKSNEGIKPDGENKPSEEYQKFLEALNEAFNHLPLTWASVLQFMKISHTSLENYVAQAKEGNTIMDIQEEMKRWMLPHYEKFDPAEESMQLKSAMSKLSSTCWDHKSKTRSDGFYTYGYGLSGLKKKTLEKKEEAEVSEQCPSPHSQQGNPESDVDPLHLQAPDHQPNRREDNTSPQLENSKDRHEAAQQPVEEKHETTLDEYEDDKNKTPDGTAQEINMTPSTPFSEDLPEVSKQHSSPHTQQGNPEINVDTLHPQPPDHQPHKREDNTSDQLENNKDRHETSISFDAPVVAAEHDECEDDKEKTPDGTAQKTNITHSLGQTSAKCQEVPPCRQMTWRHQSPDEPTSATNIPIPVPQRTLVPSDIDGIQTTHVATLRTEHIHAETTQERVGDSLGNPSQETSAKSKHSKIGEDAAALPVEEPRCDSNEESMVQALGASHYTVNALTPQSPLATASQVNRCSGEHVPTSKFDSTSPEGSTPPSERDDVNITAHEQDVAAENIDDSTQPKGELPTACIEVGIEVEGAVGGRCSPYPAQTASQEQTTSNCHSGRSNIPCPEVQNVRRSLSASWDLVHQRRREIARRLNPDLACRYLVNANVLTEDECRIIDEEEEEDKATSLLCILSAKGQEASLAFCAALEDQGLEDIAAQITGSQVSDILIPITNVPHPVSSFFETRDANDVHAAVMAQHITVLCEIAGSGKTQIARWVARQFLQHHRTAVVWVLDGQNRQTLLAGMRKILEALNAEVPDEEDTSRADEHLDQALQNRGTPVLLIVDDLEDGTLLTPTLLRERIQSRVMILTHQEDLQLPDGTPFPCTMQGFQTWEGVRFFQAGNLAEPDYQIDHLQGIADMFDGRPLGLAAAREFMQNTHTSPEHFLLLLKEEHTARILQQEAQRFMAQHYKFDQTSLHPVFQAAQDRLRAQRDTPKTDEDTEKTALESTSQYTDATSSVQDEQDECGGEVSYPEDSSSIQSLDSQQMEDEGQEEQKMAEEGQEERPTVGSQTQQSEEASSALRLQEEAVASLSPDDQDTESSSNELRSLAASTRSTEEGSVLEGAVGGIFSPPRSRTASPNGLPRALASIPPPGAHYARLAVPCHQVQPATRILCQLLRLQQLDVRQQVEDLSSSGPPAFIVLENQEFPMLPACGQLVQEQTLGTVLVYSHASEQLIATEQGHPQQFLWEVAARIDLSREVFDHNLESSFTFRYYMPRRPPDTLPFVPRDATIGTGTTVQAVAATEGVCWAWRITSTQTGLELEFYMDLESSQGGAYGYQRMAGTAHVVPAGLNPEHGSGRNSHVQQSSFLTPVSLEAERDRLQTRVGQASIPVSVQRGNEAQIVQEIIHLYLQTPSAAACRLNVQYVGESAIDCGGPGRELFMLVWRWLSERCLENGIPRQSPDLEPGTFQFWLAIGRFIFHMFVLYNCFPVHLARFVVEAMFNGTQQLRRSKVAWLTTFLDTLPANIRTLLFESYSNETAFEQNRDQLTEALMTWGMSTFPQSPADLLQMLPRVGKFVCLDSHYVALTGLINGFREGWQAYVMPGDVDRLILQHSRPTSYLDIIPALDIDASNVDFDTGRRMRGYLNRWLRNANPAMLQQFLITVTGYDQLTANSPDITIIFDPDYPANAISTCAQTLPVPVVETYDDFCTYMTGVLSGNTFNTV